MRAEMTQFEQATLSAEEWGPGYRLWQSIHTLLGQRGPEGTTSVVRMGSHLAILFVAVLVLALSRVQLPQWDITSTAPEVSDAALAEEALALANAESAEPELVTEVDDIGLVRVAVPITLIPERPRLDIITHTVAPGDTLYGIAQKYKLSAETLMFANKALETNPDLLRVGQKLLVLPVDGIYHTVAKGDTVDKLAKTYKVAPAAIVNYSWNKLDPHNPTLTVGQAVIVPGGKKTLPVQRAQVYSGPVPAGAKTGSGRFVWPTSGYVTQGYKRLHPALDIARAIGTPVKAADSGYVVVAGWSNQGYGKYIVINHGNGFQTLYAHLDQIYVSVGNVVGQGAVIGAMGNTGRSTGPHLHFEIHKNGVKLNPQSFLPR